MNKRAAEWNQNAAWTNLTLQVLYITDNKSHNTTAIYNEIYHPCRKTTVESGLELGAVLMFVNKQNLNNQIYNKLLN